MSIVMDNTDHPQTNELTPHDSISVTNRLDDTYDGNNTYFGGNLHAQDEGARVMAFNLAEGPSQHFPTADPSTPLAGGPDGGMQQIVCSSSSYDSHSYTHIESGRKHREYPLPPWKCFSRSCIGAHAVHAAANAAAAEYADAAATKHADADSDAAEHADAATDASADAAADASADAVADASADAAAVASAAEHADAAAAYAANDVCAFRSSGPRSSC